MKYFTYDGIFLNITLAKKTLKYFKYRKNYFDAFQTSLLGKVTPPSSVQYLPHVSV